MKAKTPENLKINNFSNFQSSTKITPPPIPPPIKNRSVSNSPPSLPPIEPKTPPPRLKEVPKELNNQNRVSFFDLFCVFVCIESFFIPGVD